MPPSLDQARVVLAAQPFSRLLGGRLNRFGPDGVELEVPVRPEHRQQHGSAHCGLLGSTADNALTFAAGALGGHAVLTAGYTINLLAPVVGDRLLARAWVVSAGQRLIVARCELLEPPRCRRGVRDRPGHDRTDRLMSWRSGLEPAGRGGRSCPALAYVLDQLVDGGNRDERPPPRPG